MSCEATWHSSAIVPNANSISTRLWSATRVTNLLYKIRPGVTSYATLYNGYTDTIEKMLRRLELDLYYLDNMSKKSIGHIVLRYNRSGDVNEVTDYVNSGGSTNAKRSQNF